MEKLIIEGRCSVIVKVGLVSSVGVPGPALMSPLKQCSPDCQAESSHLGHAKGCLANIIKYCTMSGRAWSRRHCEYRKWIAALSYHLCWFMVFTNFICMRAQPNSHVYYSPSEDLISNLKRLVKEWQFYICFYQPLFVCYVVVVCLLWWIII